MKTLGRRFCLTALACLALAPLRAFERENPVKDAPWKIHQTVRALYPVRMLERGITHGEARVRVSVDADGRLLDALITACTQSEFGEEALRAVQQWRYEGELVDGKIFGVVGDITFEFLVNGTVAISKRLPTAADEQRAPAEAMAYQAEPLKHLDHIPTPTNVVAPVYPEDWSDRGVNGAVTVEFYIDETGRVRIPVVTGAPYRLLASSAIAAVAQWKFEPPTRAGRPVLVRAEQTFAFAPTKK